MTCWLHVAVFLCMSCCVLGDDRPSISETIIQETKRVGETAILNCTVVNQGNFKVIWKKQSTDRTLSMNAAVPPDLQKKYAVEKRTLATGAVRYSLSVFNLERVDDGYYTCTVTVDGTDKDPSMTGKLTINLKPSINLAESSSPTIYAEIGKSFTLLCNADGVPKPKIFFRRVNGALPDGSITLEGPTVTFNDIDKSARGVYQCLADNAVDEGDIYLITVKIGFPPVTKPVQTSYGQKRDKNIILECRVAGEPEPDLEWYQIESNQQIPLRDNQKFEIAKPPNYNPQYDISELFYTITFEVGAQDYGEYMCSAKNKYGSHSSKVEVFEAYDLCQGGFCLSLQGEESGSTGQRAFISMLLLTLLACVL